MTQATFAFTATPFLLLTMSTSLKVWARLYFFVIFGVAISMAFLGSPGKAWLAQQLKRRQLPELKKVPSEKDRTQTLGVMDDPGKDFTEFTRHFANAQPAVVGKRAE